MANYNPMMAGSICGTSNRSNLFTCENWLKSPNEDAFSFCSELSVR